MTEHVILLHGLWMRAFTLGALRHRLERAGFAVDVFDYASVFRGPEASVDQLLDRVRAKKGRNVHLVGHSLGGLIALHTLRHDPDATHGRVVCLGSPLRGSAVARGIATLPGGSLLIGRSLGLLREGVDGWSGRQQVGSIAGRLPIGFGFAVGALTSPHDGTVSVAETELPGLTDHCVTPATHTGLLFSTEVAAQTISFLRTARFAH